MNADGTGEAKLTADPAWDSCLNGPPTAAGSHSCESSRVPAISLMGATRKYS